MSYSQAESAGDDDLMQETSLRRGFELAALVLTGAAGEPADTDEAIDRLVAAGEHIPAGLAGMTLARALRRRSDESRSDGRRAEASALEGLQAYAADVLLQTGAEHGLELAGMAGDDAVWAARWCLADNRPPPRSPRWRPAADWCCMPPRSAVAWPTCSRPPAGSTSRRSGPRRRRRHRRETGGAWPGPT
jgi:hypothetical protein